MNIEGFLQDEKASKNFAELFSQELKTIRGLESSKSWVIFLQGDLGVGKSYFSRALIQSYLPGKKVKSPTYTFVESYTVPSGAIHHFDLYRLSDPEELEFLGARDLLADGFLSLIEWPSKAVGELPKPDLEIHFFHDKKSRRFNVKPFTNSAEELVKNLTEKTGTLFVK